MQNSWHSKSWFCIKHSELSRFLFRRSSLLPTIPREEVKRHQHTPLPLRVPQVSDLLVVESLSLLKNRSQIWLGDGRRSAVIANVDSNVFFVLTFQLSNLTAKLSDGRWRSSAKSLLLLPLATTFSDANGWEEFVLCVSASQVLGLFINKRISASI